MRMMPNISEGLSLSCNDDNTLNVDDIVIKKYADKQNSKYLLLFWQ